MKASNKILNAILTVTIAASVTACGSKKESGTTDSSSRIVNVPTTQASGTKPIAYCNLGTGSEISAKLKAYSDGNSFNMNYVLLRLTSLPANFSSNVSYISMWKWLANSSGATYLDGTALNFMLVDAASGKALTSWKKTLMWKDISSIAESKSITDPKVFFESVTILVDLKDAAGDYDVLKITNYDLSTNTSLSQMDVLLPLFHANPADYALESNGAARSGVLQNLHPFKSYASQGFSASQFQTMANDLCF